MTATAAKVLGTSTYVFQVNYYDQYGNITYAPSLNHTNSYNRLSTRYDFEKHPIETFETTGLIIGSNPVKVMNIRTRSTYDNMGRLINYYHTSNSQAEVLLANYTYNDMGKLAEKNLHNTSGSTYLQSVDYTFNEKGWLTNINNADLSNDNLTNNDNNDLFGLELKYNNGIQIGNSATAGDMLYNGNIAEAIWKSSYDNKKKGYKYSYDDLNRIAGAAYKVYAGNWSSSTENGNYNLNSISYDRNGNISTLQSNGPLTASTYGLMDNLSYTYSGNRLLKVADPSGSTTYPYDFQDGVNTGNDYAYDDNGNMVQDLNKNIFINYNYLNQPSYVGSGSYPSNIVFTYDATGKKVKKEIYNSGSLTSRTDYSGSVQFQDGNVDFVFTPEGRARNTGGATTSLKYEYTIKDQLGNSRLSFDQNTTTGTAEIIQMDDYYPHGNTFNSVTPANKNNYLYNGKEFQPELNFNSFDYGARMLDPQVGRWWVVDPSADQRNWLSPYNYAQNNPIFRIDPTGTLDTGWWLNKISAEPDTDDPGKTYSTETGEMIHDDGINDKKVYLGTKSDGSDRKYIGQESDFKDVTAKFNDQLTQTESFFSKKAADFSDIKTSNKLADWLTETYGKLDYFKSQVTDGGPFDIKQAGKGFSQKEIGTYSFYNGKLLRYDDYGNFNYGVAAKSFGLSQTTALLGAGLNQFGKTFSIGSGNGRGDLVSSPFYIKYNWNFIYNNWYPSNLSGFTDDPRDSHMIRNGYNR